MTFKNICSSFSFEFIVKIAYAGTFDQTENENTQKLWLGFDRKSDIDGNNQYHFAIIYGTEFNWNIFIFTRLLIHEYAKINTKLESLNKSFVFQVEKVTAKEHLKCQWRTPTDSIWEKSVYFLEGSSVQVDNPRMKNNISIRFRKMFCIYFRIRFLIEINLLHGKFKKKKIIKWK